MSLRFDFLESGIGETILITFPDGKMGVIDAHPSFDGYVRALDLLRDKEIVFVHLTHPHLDHGKGLIPLINTHPKLGDFWHTVSGIQSWVYSAEEYRSYPSYIRQTIEDYMQGSGNFLRELFGGVANKKLTVKTLHSGIKPFNISGVVIHVLAPDESEINDYQTTYKLITEGQRKNIPDPNRLSSILAIEYGDQVVLLGGDALKKSWTEATKKFRALNLPKCRLLKVPHHGASNALDLQANESATYLGVCEKSSIAVIFAGDLKHPEKRVESRIRKKMDLHCLVNGANHSLTEKQINPLGIKVAGARAANVKISSCQDSVSVVLTKEGQLSIVEGIDCVKCKHSVACSV